MNKNKHIMREIPNDSEEGEGIDGRLALMTKEKD
jgi:hypothetical protein